jgi:hypothetical protein
VLCVVGNFDAAAQTGSFTFPSAGTWYDYLNGNTYTASGAAQNITLQPGEFHIYLNRNLVNAVVTSVVNVGNSNNQFSASVYPNPAAASTFLDINIISAGKVSVTLLNQVGQKVKDVYTGFLPKGKHQINFSDKITNAAGGIYYLTIQSGQTQTAIKLLVK